MGDERRLGINGRSREFFGDTLRDPERYGSESEKELVLKLRSIRLVAMSFCGVLTPPYVDLDEKGKRTFRLSQRDLLAVEVLKKKEFRVMVLSNRHAVVRKRCERMDIECFAADQVAEANGKDGLLRKILWGTDILMENVLYVGDEINDLAVMGLAGVAVAVNDAAPEVRDAADYITITRGGEHAVREVAEMLLATHGKKFEL